MKEKEVDIITLGCSKNLVDAERLMKQIELAGYTCVHDSPHPHGEIAVINTCGFIGDAKEESIQTILQFAQRKEQGKLHKLFVMGCLSQRYMNELKTELPEVDEWFGKFDYMGILNALPKTEETCVPDTCARYERTLTTPKHYTYLKIAEGCNRFCSYCAIPLITGHYTSIPVAEILDEVRWLVKQGVKEFNVIAQDLSSYGLDLYKEHRLAQLIDAMAQIDGVKWIRLHYAYPTDFPLDLLPVMAKHANICKYLDIALQHCSDNMLDKMRRHITRQQQDALIARIRHEVPGICIRTTLLLGHPGETEQDFNELCEWVKNMRFERMGAFAYSDEEGTYANLHYTDNIPQEVKEHRVAQIMEIQQTISSQILRQMVGTRQRVIIDRKENGYYVGRTQYDSPEVDCEVLIQTDTCNRRMRIGELYTVTITKSEDFDLYASL